MADNSEQVEFWNSPSGEKWVELKPTLDPLFRDITALLMDGVDPQPGEHVLDIGCGGGETSMLMGERVGEAGSVLGVDISRPLLGRANAVRDAERAANVRFVLADAQAHHFGPPSFDAVSSRFGVMFFSDPVAAFANVASAMRPDGRCAFVCWDGPSVNPWFSIPRVAAVERMGEPAPAEPREPGPMAFAEQDYVRDILNQAGFSDIEIGNHEIHLRHAADADATATLACNLGPASRIVREFSGTDEDTAAIAEKVAAEFQQFETPDGVAVPGRVHLVEARV